MFSDLASNNDDELNEVDGGSVSGRFLWFLVLGFVLVFVGIAVIVYAAALSGGGSSSAGVVILIGPIPIVFGSGPEGLVLVLAGVVLTILSVVLFMVLNRRIRKVDV